MKQLLFFFLIFLLMLIFPKGLQLLQQETKLGNTNSIILFSFVGTLLLFLIYNGVNSKCSQTDKFKFDTEHKQKCPGKQFRFEENPVLKCRGGHYMYSSAPKKVQDFCNQLLSTKEGRDIYSSVIHRKDPSGKPIYIGPNSTLSDDNWQNNMCSK